MKTKLVFFSLFIFTLASVGAQPFLVPSNPPPTVQIAWNPVTFPGVTNYTLYYGAGSQQYTARLPLGNVTNTTFALPARGVMVFFAVTCTAGGLESPFSTELAYSAPMPPPAPTMKPLVVLTVQSSPTPQGMFADTGMTYSTSPDGPESFYRLKINRGFAFTTSPPPMPSLAK
jgi:hypothetical protein